MQDIVRSAQKTSQATAQPASAPPIGRSTKGAANLNGIKPHKTQSASTLMRRAVLRPGPALKRQITVSVPAHPGSFGIRVHPKKSIQQVDARRENRAKVTPKSEAVRRFAVEKRTWFSGHEDAAVKVTHSAAVPASHISAPARSMDIFQRAIDQATAHQQKPVDPKRVAKATKQHAHRSARPKQHRLRVILSITIVVLLLAGVMGYQYRGAITLRFADTAAGFHAQLPEQIPSGYTASKYTYAAGTITTEYVRSGTNRHFSLSQTSSKLTDNQLQQSIRTSTPQYDTLQKNGHTMYIYGSNNASWLADGMLFEIISDGNLSTSDLVQIASSL